VRRQFDIITPSGKFVGLIQAGDADGMRLSQHIQVVLNWFEELKARVPIQ
jgi:hypothetical protein